MRKFTWASWARIASSLKFASRKNGRKIRRKRSGVFSPVAAEVELLESRVLLSALTPAQITQAYAVDQIAFGSTKGTGAGQTIAIVDAYDAPDVTSDLTTFDKTYNLSNTDGTGAPVVTKATPQGTPAYNAGWAEEITLDIEWAHAIAPGAHILLVEAASDSLNNLLAAVSYASDQPGVSVVSMSWGSTEFSNEASFDSTFTTPAGHSNVSFIASAGDSGAVTEWPAVSPNVVAVGGTQLSIADSSGTYGSEMAWSDSGGGISQYEVKPSFQTNVAQSSTNRTSPDVAWDASPNSGVSVYFSGNKPASGGWYTFGGTSVGAPSWAGVIAIADQGRVLAGEAPLDGPSQLLPALYSLPSSDFHDVTSGSATSASTTNQAAPGYDLVTGRGSPYANLVVAGLVSWGSTSQQEPPPPAPPPPPPSQPTLTAPQVSAVDLSFTTVELKWNPVTGTQGYRVYMQEGGQRVLLGTVSSSTTAVEVSGLRPGQTAQFQVEAFAGTKVADSAWVTVTTPFARFSSVLLLHNASSNANPSNGQPGFVGSNASSAVSQPDTLLGLSETAAWQVNSFDGVQDFDGSETNPHHRARKTGHL